MYVCISQNKIPVQLLLKWMHHGFGLEFVVHLPCNFLDKFIFCFIILGRMIPSLKIQQEFTGP